MPGAECLLLSNAGIFLRTAKSLTNSYGVAIIEDVQPGYYQVNDKIMTIFIHCWRGAVASWLVRSTPERAVRV